MAKGISLVGSKALPICNDGSLFVTHRAHITVHTNVGSIILECKGQVPLSETSEEEFLLACLDKQNELAKIVEEELSRRCYFGK